MRKEMRYALDVAAHKEMCANAKSVESIDFAKKVTFMKGAYWFRNNVWHKAGEFNDIKDQTAPLVILNKKGLGCVTSWKCAMMPMKDIYRWCYLEDILPDKE
jgi:hypothetical protein